MLDSCDSWTGSFTVQVNELESFGYLEGLELDDFLEYSKEDDETDKVVDFFDKMIFPDLNFIKKL